MGEKSCCSVILLSTVYTHAICHSHSCTRAAKVRTTYTLSHVMCAKRKIFGMNPQQVRAVVQTIARKAMIERGLVPDFPAQALAVLDRIQAPKTIEGNGIRDLRGLLWASIDNDDSRDLDQLSAAEAVPGEKTRILVAVADVDSLVPKGSTLDKYAQHNTTSVYTPAKIFPMLPERLSNDL